MTNAEYQRRLYAANMKLHICTRCGAQDAYTLAGHSRCFECAEKRRKHPVEFVPENKKPKSNPRELGVRCWICNKEPLFEDKKLCRNCYEKAVFNLAKGREMRKNNMWKNFVFGTKHMEEKHE